MTDISTASVLAQIRALNNEAGAIEASTIRSPTVDSNDGSFSKTLSDSLAAVNEVQHASNAKAVSFQAGDEDTSLVDVMLTSQKASLSFHAATEVRNKLVNAYQEIMNMAI